MAKTKSESTGPRGEKKPKEPEKKPVAAAGAPSATEAAPKARRVVKGTSAPKAAPTQPEEPGEERDEEDERDGDGDDEVVEVTVGKVRVRGHGAVAEGPRVADVRADLRLGSANQVCSDSDLRTRVSARSTVQSG